MFPVHALDQLFRADTFCLGTQHDGRAVSVVCAHKNTLMTAQLLKTHPDIRLHILEHVADMNRSICIRQRAGDHDLARFGAHGGLA